MFTVEQIQELNAKIPEHVFTYGINREQPFLFLDFEVFAKDWLICFSTDGINIKHIVNDSEKFKKLILNRLHDRILIGYNGTGYDRYINLAILNDINYKEVNDSIINNFMFNFNKTYKHSIRVGNDLMWYEPASRLGGSLKTYEACEGENIYESKVDFNLTRKLTQDEIDETLQYCSFDVKMLIKYFYKENFDSFLGHIGLVDSTLQARSQCKMHDLLPRTDASLVGTYLCSNPVPDPTKETDVITLPENINLGKYADKINEFLKIPIKILKRGSYNGLNSWSLNTIKKSLDLCSEYPDLDKLKTKEQKCIDKIKKIKIQILEFKNKEKLTEKQQEKLEFKLPNDLQKELEKLKEIQAEIPILEKTLNDLKELKSQLDNYENNDYCSTNYNYILSKILMKAQITDNPKLKLLISYLQQSEEQLYNLRFKADKKESVYNSIMLEYPFELILDIKGVPHAFKTGGIHSIARYSMFFDKNTEKDKDKMLIIADVGSLYPNIMRVFNLCSIAMDDPAMFGQMIFDRIKLKKTGDPFANVLKLILNTTYGCMGSDTNPLRDPTNRLKVCIFGQCTIIDLLDKLEDQIQTLEIFQSNTDGIIIACHKDEYDLCEAIIHDWEERTGLEMEIEQSRALYQKDVSNYILLKE